MAIMDKDRLLELWKTGLSNRKIAKEIGFSHQLISTTLKEMGLKTNGYLPIDKKLLVELHGQGLDDYQIAEKMQASYSAIFRNRKELGLISNGNIKNKLEIITSETAKCSVCKKIQNIKEFKSGKLRSGGNFQLSYCNRCLVNKKNIAVNNSIIFFLRDRLSAIKKRSKDKKIRFELTKEDLVEQYNKQNGKCFYTGVELVAKRGTGINKNALSVDRKDPDLGYIKENIALCTNRVNSIKNNLTIEELKELIPSWYNKIYENQ